MRVQKKPKLLPIKLKTVYTTVGKSNLPKSNKNKFKRYLYCCIGRLEMSVRNPLQHTVPFGDNL